MITEEFLKRRAERATQQGYSKQKWVEFCEYMLDRGYRLEMYEARRTVSKYITVTHPDRPGRVKIRFSNHRPIPHREAARDCDFFVGHTNFTITNTKMAIEFVEQKFGRPPARCSMMDEMENLGAHAC